MSVAKKDLRSRNLMPFSLSNARPHLVMASSPFRSPVLFQCRFLSEAASLFTRSRQCFDSAAQTDAFLVLGVTYAYTPLGQQANVPTPPPTLTPTYDDDGNTLTDGTGKIYTWDCENRLTQVTLPNNEIVRYYYDTNSRRVKREHITPTKTEITYYLYDEWNVIHETITQDEIITNLSDNTTVSSTTAISRTYTWGLDLMGGMQEYGGVCGLLSSKGTSYLYDGNGSVSDLLSLGGEITAHYEYDVFGKIVISSGVMADNNNYCFSTKSDDRVTRLLYYGTRYFSYDAGRWMKRDVGGEYYGNNLYAFCENDSLYSIDVLGLESEDGQTGDGFRNPFTCSRKMLRNEVDVPTLARNIFERIGLKEIKAWVFGEIKSCCGCCKKDGTKRESKSASLKFSIEAEVGTPPIDFYFLEVRFGWYGRLGGQGSISVRRNACTGGRSDSGCVGIYGELGLIVSANTKGKGITVGGRGGANLSFSLCVACSADDCVVTGKLCGAARARVWGRVNIPFLGRQKEISQEWRVNFCTPSVELFRI
jgi:RHS repeat-associated protein